MNCRLLSLLCLWPVLAVLSVRADVYELIQSGKTDEALDSISALSSTFSEHGNLLFYRGLLEPDGDSSVALLREALENNVDPRFEQVIVSRLAWCYLAVGELDSAAQQAATYCARWRDGSEAAAMTRISILATEKSGDQPGALEQAEQFLSENPTGGPSQWVTIDCARLVGAEDRSAELARRLKKIMQDHTSPAAAVALEQLIQRALASRQPDNAVAYFGSLKEQFPNAVGLGAIADQMTDLPEDSSTDAQAEKITGTYYAVKVGVFSSKENADKQVARCRQGTQPFSIDSKEIGGKTYYIVYVGRFREYAEAQALKAKLEGQFGETYQVSAR
jgi:cell division septation protein DedD